MTLAIKTCLVGGFEVFHGNPVAEQRETDRDSLLGPCWSSMFHPLYGFVKIQYGLAFLVLSKCCSHFTHVESHTLPTISLAAVLMDVASKPFSQVQVSDVMKTTK